MLHFSKIIGRFVFEMRKPTKKKLDPYLVALGERITSLMKERGITQLEMAELLKTQNTQVRRIQRGEVNSTINMLRKIAGILKVKVSELVDLD